MRCRTNWSWPDRQRGRGPRPHAPEALMILLLVRHADAGDRDPAQWPDDRLRPMTDKGRKVQTKVAKALRTMNRVPEVIVTSPWARAAQTAEVMQGELGIAAPP